MLKPESSQLLLVAIIAFTALVPPSWSSEAYPPLVAAEAGRAVSTAFLVELTDPLRSKPGYRIGIVLAENGSGVLVPPKGGNPEVEYITHADDENIPGSRTLVHAAIDQVRQPLPDGFHFEVIRKLLTAETCPQLEKGLAGFYKVLQSALSVPVDLAGQAGQAGQILSISKPPSDYRIQITTNGATLSLNRVSETLPGLEDVLNPLMTILASCAASTPVSVSQEYSFSYGGRASCGRPDPQRPPDDLHIRTYSIHALAGSQCGRDSLCGKASLTSLSDRSRSPSWLAIRGKLFATRDIRMAKAARRDTGLNE